MECAGGRARVLFPFVPAAAAPLSIALVPAARSRRKLKEAWESEGTLAQWEASSWAQKRKRSETRKTLTDFQRFEAMLARKDRSSARKAKM